MRNKLSGMEEALQKQTEELSQPDYAGNGSPSEQLLALVGKLFSLLELFFASSMKEEGELLEFSSFVWQPWCLCRTGVDADDLSDLGFDFG